MSVGHQGQIPLVLLFIFAIIDSGSCHQSFLDSFALLAISSIMSNCAAYEACYFGRLLSFGSGRFYPLFRVFSLGHKSCIGKKRAVVVDSMAS